MLKLAITYKDKLNNEFQKVVFNDKYKYYLNDNYWNYNLKLSEDSWGSIELVSVDNNDNVRGFFRASISRTSDMISGLCIMNFLDKNVVFSKDLYQFLVDLFEKYNFRKIEFTVVVGNPVEKMYDKYVKKYGGTIAGIRRATTKLIDGDYYDVKDYEIFRQDYLKNKKMSTRVHF